MNTDTGGYLIEIIIFDIGDYRKNSKITKGQIPKG